MTAPASPYTFSAVPWLPPFRLAAETLLEGELEVTHPGSALFPFALLRPTPAPLRLLPHPPGEAAMLAGRDPAVLRARLAAIPATDLATAARGDRWTFGTALAAAEGSAALRVLGGLAGWPGAAAERRAWYLNALDAGRPPPASDVLAACRAVPHAFRHLGKALPTAEAVRLLAPLGRICELGAGFGLFARALERAGMLVAASDADASANAGVAFPVRRGFDAAATIAAFAALGPVPPLLMVWPHCDEGDWFAEVFATAPSGQLVAMASPEFEFCAAGGLDAVPPGGKAPAPGWVAAAALAGRLAEGFDVVGEAPVVAAGWPMTTTPLRLWRRR